MKCAITVDLFVCPVWQYPCKKKIQKTFAEAELVEPFVPPLYGYQDGGKAGQDGSNWNILIW